MNKKTILIYSDCSFFAGCENMISNFLNSDEFYRKYKILFAYRKSIAYERGLYSRVHNDGFISIPIDLPKENLHKDLLIKFRKDTLLYKILAAIIILPWKYYSIFWAVFPLYKMLKKQKIEILHINNGGYPAAISSYSILIAAKIVGIKKIVYVVNNIAQDYKHPIRWFDYFLDIFVKNYVSIFITGSKNASKELSRVLKLDKSKVINIANGTRPREITKTKQEYLDSLNLNLNGRLLFSTVAILEERKGHIWLLKAIKHLKTIMSSADIPFFIFEGVGIQKKTLLEYISKNELEDDVMLIGNMEHIFNLLNASDVIVVPSISNEDFPNVIIEAMSLGKPVIGTNIAGIPEQINHDLNGYIVEPKNITALSDVMYKIINKNVIKSFSINAINKFNSEFTIEHSIDRYLNTYQNL